MWKFSNPISIDEPPANAAPPPFQIVSNEARVGLGMNDEQRQQLDEFGKTLNAKLDEILTTDQKRILTGPDDIDSSTMPAGEYLWAFQNDKLGLIETQIPTLQSLAQE